MTRKEILAMVRKLIADEQATGFTEGGNLEEPEGTQELENYLNRAVDEYSKRQAGLKDVRLVKEKELSDGATLPTNYLAFCGAMPVRVLGNKIKFYVASSNPIAVRYFLPYDEDQSIAISALAAIYALNKHEYNISQHLMLMGYGAASNASQ